ncbi:MAG: hypothetical protein J5527_08870 [Treponema sp.]|nr:hypothetical protein [Treponema sp.]
MDYSEYDKAEQEKRKQSQIEYRNKKRYSSVFIFVASIFEIVETFLLIFLGIIIISFFMFRVFHLSPESYSTLFSILLIVNLVGGLILGFKIYKKAIVWFIKKRHLEDKLSEEIVNHYLRDPKQEKKNKQTR